MKRSIEMKKVLIVWISIYPAITVILLLFGNELNSMPVFLRTFVLTVILVPLMVHILIPFWSKVFKFVYEQTSERKKKADNN